MYPVMKGSNLSGCVNLEDIKTVPRSDWRENTVDKLMKPCTNDNTIKITDNSVKAISVMSRTGNATLLVVDKKGNLAGMVTLKDLLKFLSIKLNLGEMEE